MGMVRIAIVVAAGVALLPSDREQQQRLMQRASDATTWAVTYCDRNVETCAHAAGLWKQFVAKAEFGAKLAYDMMQDAASERRTAEATDERSAPRAAPAALERRGTLTPNDLRPGWRGQTRGRGSI